MPHKFDPSQKKALDSPERLEVLDPYRILSWAGVSSGHTLADIGCGTGFFSIPASQLVQETGSVYGIDISREMLASLQIKAKRKQIKNIKIMQSQECEIPLEKRTLDFALLAFVLHEVSDRVKFLKDVAVYLKPDGRLILLEWKKKKDVEGPPFKDRISLRKMLYLAEKAYLKVERRKDLNPQHYLAIFSIFKSK